MTGQGLPATVKRMVRSGAQVPDSWVPWRLPATTVGVFMRSYLAFAVPTDGLYAYLSSVDLASVPVPR